MLSHKAFWINAAVDGTCTSCHDACLPHFIIKPLVIESIVVHLANVVKHNKLLLYSVDMNSAFTSVLFSKYLHLPFNLSNAPQPVHELYLRRQVLKFLCLALNPTG